MPHTTYAAYHARINANRKDAYIMVIIRRIPEKGAYLAYSVHILVFCVWACAMIRFLCCPLPSALCSLLSAEVCFR